jgi:hypothetical protein
MQRIISSFHLHNLTFLHGKESLPSDGVEVSFSWIAHCEGVALRLVAFALIVQLNEVGNQNDFTKEQNMIDACEGSRRKTSGDGEWKGIIISIRIHIHIHHSA